MAGSSLVERHLLGSAEPIPPDALWIDMVEPTREEDHKVEAFIGGSVPTREDMKDIEPSELLYSENGVRYMTARLVCRADTDDACLTGVTFILQGQFARDGPLRRAEGVPDVRPTRGQAVRLRPRRAKRSWPV